MRLSLKHPQYRLMFALVCCFALLAACGPQATPTPTAAPTEVEEDEAAETEAAEVEDTADEANAEDAETEEAVDAAGDADATEAAADDATEEAAADADTTEEAADAGDESADATEAAGSDSGAASTGLTATVNVSSTRMRESPSVAANVVAELTRDAQVDVLGRSQDNGYLFVRTEDGQEGWVAKQTMALSDPVAEIEVVSP